jgi:hypothetical protein
MLEPSQRILLQVIERFGNATLGLAKSVEPLPKRLSYAWGTIGSLQLESDFKLLPDYLRRQIESLQSSLDMNQAFGSTTDQMSSDQIENCITQIVDIYTCSISRRTLKGLQSALSE